MSEQVFEPVRFFGNFCAFVSGSVGRWEGLEAQEKPGQGLFSLLSVHDVDLRVLRRKLLTLKAEHWDKRSAADSSTKIRGVVKECGNMWKEAISTRLAAIASIDSKSLSNMSTYA